MCIKKSTKIPSVVQAIKATIHASFVRNQSKLLYKEVHTDKQ